MPLSPMSRRIRPRRITSRYSTISLSLALMRSIHCLPPGSSPACRNTSSASVHPAIRVLGKNTPLQGLPNVTRTSPRLVPRSTKSVHEDGPAHPRTAELTIHGNTSPQHVAQTKQLLGFHYYLHRHDRAPLLASSTRALNLNKTACSICSRRSL